MDSNSDKICAAIVVSQNLGEKLVADWFYMSKVSVPRNSLAANGHAWSESLQREIHVLALVSDSPLAQLETERGLAEIVAELEISQSNGSNLGECAACFLLRQQELQRNRDPLSFWKCLSAYCGRSEIDSEKGKSKNNVENVCSQVQEQMSNLVNMNMTISDDLITLRSAVELKGNFLLAEMENLQTLIAQRNGTIGSVSREAGSTEEILTDQWANLVFENSVNERAELTADSNEEREMDRTIFSKEPGCLLALGGVEDFIPQSWLMRWQVGDDQWSTLAPMSDKRSNFPAISLGGKVIAVGGWDGCQHLRSVEAFDVETQAWASLSPLPVAISQSSSAVVDGRIYVISWDQRSLLIYHTQLNAWTSLPYNQSNGGCIGLTAVDHILYACGNRTLSIFDGRCGYWFNGAPMLQNHQTCHLAEVGGKVYSVGGMAERAVSKGVEVYAPVSNHWEYRASLSTGRYEHALVAMQNRLYTLGGKDSHRKVLKTVEVYDALSDQWNLSVPLKMPLWDVAVVAV